MSQQKANQPDQQPDEVSREERRALVRRADDEISFLRGPQRRTTELFRVFRIAFEFIRGFRALHFVGPCVTVFGSARFQEGNEWYEMGRQVGSALADLGFTVMTGGGPGIMEAANRGAKEADGHSIGVGIELPFEQAENEWIDTWVQFRYFFVRKVMLVKYSYGFVIMPGGFGTMDELFETLTLVQTGKIKDFPLVLMGSDYWNPILDFMRNELSDAGAISPDDLDLIKLTDSVDEAMEHLREHAIEEFGLEYSDGPKRSWWLGEK